jgi:hypothetical protein
MLIPMPLPLALLPIDDLLNLCAYLSSWAWFFMSPCPSPRLASGVKNAYSAPHLFWTLCSAAVYEGRLPDQPMGRQPRTRGQTD